LGRQGSRRPDTTPPFDFSELVTEVLNRLDPALKAARSLEYIPAPDETQMLASIITQDMGSSLRYLGPLRDEPKPVYGIANSADPSHVGYKGEYTAAVLDLYARQDIEFVTPAEPGKIRKAPLADAVQLWLEYFDMATSYNTREEGKL